MCSWIPSGLLLAATVLLGACATTPEDDVERMALGGDPTALNLLCYGYIYGQQGYPLDYGRARKWCKLGAESGDPNDETLYAEMYEEGYGVKKDPALARAWYKRAAEQGHPHAQFMMAEMELGPDADYHRFCYWLTQSRLQGYEKALTLYDHMAKEWSVSHPDRMPLCLDVDMAAEPQ